VTDGTFTDLKEHSLIGTCSGYVPSGRCEKNVLERGTISALKKNAPGCLISDRWAFGIHFGSDEISAKSIFSHLPVTQFSLDQMDRDAQGIRQD
jgi:hypothetical protein